MEFQADEPEVVSAFSAAFGISQHQGRFVEVVDESKVLFTSGTSLAVYDSAINKREYIRSEGREEWFRILASAVNFTRTHCAVVVLAGKPSVPRVRRASVIQRRGSVIGPVQGQPKATGVTGERPSSAREPGARGHHGIPIAVAIAHLESQHIEQQVQLSKSYFADPTTVCFCRYSHDGKVICVGNSEPENKVIVLDPKTAELLFTFNAEERMIDVRFTVEKRFKQSEVYALLVLSASKLQAYKQEDKRTTFTNSKVLAQNKQGKFTCLSNSIRGEHFAIGSKDGSIGFYGYSSHAKGGSELKRVSLNGRTPHCITIARNGNYLLCGCDGGRVLVFEDFESLATTSGDQQGEGRRKAKVKGSGLTSELGFQYRLRCHVDLIPMGRSPVVKIMLDLSTCTTVCVGERNQIAGYSTQTILSGKIASSTVENDYGEVSAIQRELSTYTEGANEVCSTPYGPIASMDTCVSQGLIATLSSNDNAVRIWDADTLNCEVVAYFPSKEDIEAGFQVEGASVTLGPPECVAFLPSGYHICVCHDEGLSLFYILHNRLELAHTFPVSHCFRCSVSKGGNLVAAISGNEIVVFQTHPPYSHFATLKGHLGAVSSLCWSRDDLRLASTCVRGSALLWDMNPEYRTKAERVQRLKQEEYIKKIDSFVDVAIDDVEPLLKERTAVVVSFDGSIQFLKNGNVHHRLGTKGLNGDRATVVRFTTVTMHYESDLTKDLRRMDSLFDKNEVRPKVGVLLVGTHTGNIIAFTNWRRLQRNNASQDTLEESMMGAARRHILPRCHSEQIVDICAMDSAFSGSTNEYNTVISCCAGGNVCISYMALEEEGEGGFRQRGGRQKIFTSQDEISQFVLVPHTLIKNFDSEIKEFKMRVQELNTEVEYQRERSAKQQRDTLKIFHEKESTLASKYRMKTVDLEQALERAEKTADVKVKALSQKQEELLQKAEENFESKLYRELEISSKLRQEQSLAAIVHKQEKKQLQNSLEGKYEALEHRMNERVDQLQDEKKDLKRRKADREREMGEFLRQTESNFDQDLESELLRTALLEKELRQKIHDANLEARMHKRSYDQLIEKLERERKEEHDHASEKEDLKAQIADLEKECLKFEDLIKERESQLVEKEVENEDLVRELNEKEKQIFLHQELERDMKERFIPIKEKLEVSDERILLQDAEVEKQFNRLKGQKVQIEDKDRLIRTLRGELNKEVDRARLLKMKLEQMEYELEQRPLPRAGREHPLGGSSGAAEASRPAQQSGRGAGAAARRRPQSSPVYRGGGGQRSRGGRPKLGGQGQGPLPEEGEEEGARLSAEFQRQRNAIEKTSEGLLRRANYFEERVNEISEQRMAENRELLDENIKLRKKLKDAERTLRQIETEELQRASVSKIQGSEGGAGLGAAALASAELLAAAREGGARSATAAQGGQGRPSSALAARSLRPRPKSAAASFLRPASGALVRGSTSRLIKSVSVADKERITSLMSELREKNARAKEQNEEISRLRNMVNTYRDEKAVYSRSGLRPSSAPPKRWK